MEIVIYPNNEVTVDGFWTIWGENTFKRFGIPLIRPYRPPWANLAKGREARRFQRSGMRFLVFPTESFFKITHSKSQRDRRRTWNTVEHW